MFWQPEEPRSTRDIIVLVNPSVMSEEKKKQSTQYFPKIPISLLAVSRSVLKQGFQVKIIDLNIKDEWDFIEASAANILCVGLTAMTSYQIKSGLTFAQRFKNKYRAIPVVWGGVHVTLLPEESLENQFVDIVVMGQGELTLLELAQKLQIGESIESQKGIGFKKGDQVIINPPNVFVALDELPPVPYDLIDIKLYFDRQLEVLGEVQFPYLSSIGCPFRCTFCAPKLIAPRWSALPPKRVVAEVQMLKKRFAFQKILFYDQEFFINIDRAVQIAQGFVDTKLNISWSAQIRANILEKVPTSALTLLKESGLDQLDIGVESGSQEMLKRIRKAITATQVINGLEKIRQVGLRTACNFIYGFPQETKNDVYDNFKLTARIKEILPDTILPLFFFEPYPGVPIYEAAVIAGAIRPKSLQEWGDMLNYSFSDISPFVTWLDNKYKDLVYRVVIFYIPLAFPANMERGTIVYFKDKLERHPLRLFLKLIHKISLWRVKNQFYFLPIEWRIFKLFRNINRF